MQAVNPKPYNYMPSKLGVLVFRPESLPRVWELLTVDARARDLGKHLPSPLGDDGAPEDLLQRVP